MVQLSPELLKRASPVQRYGLAVVAVAVALGAALLVNRYKQFADLYAGFNCFQMLML
jgi:hypothetical protein